MFANFPNKPLIVYLDQNKWIDLARAYIGHTEGKGYQEILKQIISASKQEKAIFPLSLQHFIETRRQKNVKRRRELAMVMAEISRGICLAPKRNIMLAELQRAIAIAFDKQPMPMPPVFGYGMSIIFGRNFLEKEFQNLPLRNLQASLDRAKSILSDTELTVEFLMGNDEELNSEITRGLTRINQSFMEKMEESKELEKDCSDDFRERAYLAILTRELLPEIIKILNVYGKTKDDFFGLGLDKVKKFFHNVPTLDVEIELAIILDKQKDRKLKLNDTTDIGFASMAIPYCDVVITENTLWSLAIQRKLDTKYKTAVLNDLNNLMPYLKNL